MVLSLLWHYPHYGIIPFMVLSSFIYFYPPYFFCKVNANERNGKEILSFYLLRSMISIIFLPSLYLPSCHLYIYLPSLSEVVFTTSLHPHQEPAATFAPIFMYKKWGSEQAQHPSLPHSLYIKSEKSSFIYLFRG